MAATEDMGDKGVAGVTRDGDDDAEADGIEADRFGTPEPGGGELALGGRDTPQVDLDGMGEEETVGMAEQMTPDDDAAGDTAGGTLVEREDLDNSARPTADSLLSAIRSRPLASRRRGQNRGGRFSRKAVSHSSVSSSPGAGLGGSWEGCHLLARAFHSSTVRGKSEGGGGVGASAPPLPTRTDRSGWKSAVSKEPPIFL